MNKITIAELLDIYDIDKEECVDILSDRTNILDGVQRPISESFSMIETLDLHIAFGKFFRNEMDRLYDYIDENCEI